MGDFIDKIKRYFRFNKEEVKALLISSVIIGVIFALRGWGDATIGGLISALLIVLASLTFHVASQKIFSLHIGFGAEYKLWWNGLLISLIVSIITRGRVWWLILPGGIIFSLMARHRLGKFRYGLNYWPMGWIGLAGPVASIIFAAIFKNINLYILSTPLPLFDQIFAFNLAFAVCTMLPIPPLDGHYMFFASRPWFALLFGVIFAYAILALVFEFYSYIWALIIGGVIWLIYYLTFEQKAWLAD